MSFSVNLDVKHDEIILAVVLKHCLSCVHFRKSNAVDASQVFKTVIKWHHINISVFISSGTFFSQYFIDILHTFKTGLGIPATVCRIHFGDTVSS